MTTDGTMDDGKGRQSDRQHDNGAGRHGDGDVIFGKIWSNLEEGRALNSWLTGLCF